MSKFEKLLSELNEEHNGAGFTFCTNEEKETLIKSALLENRQNELPSSWNQEIEHRITKNLCFEKRHSGFDLSLFHKFEVCKKCGSTNVDYHTPRETKKVFFDSKKAVYKSCEVVLYSSICGECGSYGFDKYKGKEFEETKEIFKFEDFDLSFFKWQ